MATPLYPVMLDLEGRRVLVVGGGAVATRKVQRLLEAGARIQVVAPSADERIIDAAAGGLLVWDARGYVAGTVRDASTPWALVVAATDDAALNAQIVDEATKAGTWANDVTAPGGGPVSLPALHTDGPLTVAVGTSGASPATAAFLRDEVARALGPEHRTLVELAAEARDQAKREKRTIGAADWRSALDSGMLDLIRRGRIAEAKERLQACLSSSSD